MRSKVTVVLLFLNVALLFYIFYFERHLQDERDLLVAKRRVLPTEIASMDSFTRLNRTGEKVVLKKSEDSTWWLHQPYVWLANPNAVSRIHNELQFLENETSFSVADLQNSGQGLADYGLADPALQLEFTAAKQTFTLLIGDETKAGNRLYVLSPDGTRIHVVSRSLAESVGLPLTDLRAESIFTIPVFEVRSLNIQTAAPSNLKVRLRRDANARWAFEAPILARAAKATIEVAINALNGLTARSFVDPLETDLSRAGLVTPPMSVTLEGNARRETLLIGNPTGQPDEYFAKIEDKSVVFTTVVPAPLLEVLRTSQESLRDQRVTDFDPTTVTSLAIATPGQPVITLQRLDAAQGWQVVTRTTGQTPLTMTADTDVVAELIQKIQRLSARKFLSDAPSASDIENYGFSRPEREITLGLNTGGGPAGKEPSTQVLQVGVSLDQPGKAFARLTNPPFVYEILPDIMEDAPTRALHYRQRLLRELPESAIITHLALVDLTTGTSIYAQKLKEGDKNWEAALAVEAEPLRQTIANILTQLRTLRAQRFNTDTFNPEHAESVQGPKPWRYRLDYTVTFNASGTTQSTPSSLFLTERLGGMTQLAGTADFGGVVFRITQEFIDALFPLTYGEPNDPGPTTTVAPPAPTPAAAETPRPAGT